MKKAPKKAYRKRVSISEESLEESIPEESLVSDVSEEPVDMPVGIGEVDGIFYLNFEDGNYVETPNKPIIPVIYFADFDEFKSKIKNLNFNEEEKYIIKATFKRNKYGIKFINPDKIYEPKGIPKEMNLEEIAFLGNLYTYSYVSDDGRHIQFSYISRNNFTVETTESRIKEYNENKDITDIKVTAEKHDGYEKNVVNYTTKTRVKVLEKVWDYKAGDITFFVTEYYFSGSDTPATYIINGYNEEYCFSLTGNGIPADANFLSNLSMELPSQ